MKSSLRVFFLIMIVSLLSSCNLIESDNKILAHKVASLMSQSIDRSDVFGGVVVAQQSKEFNKDDSKVVKEIFVKEGDVVTADTIIFSYDTDALSIEVEKAQLEIDRLNNLITSNYTEINDLVNEKATVDASQQFSYTLKIQELEAEIRETEYNIKAKNVDYERLVASMGNAEVKAEIDGIVQSINETDQYDPYTGNMQPFMTILQTGNFRIKGQINEMNISQIYEGVSVKIISRLDSSITWLGIVEVIEMNNPSQNTDFYGMTDSEMDSSSNYPFYVSLEATDGLFLGQHVYISLNEFGEIEKTGAWVYFDYLVFSEDGEMQIWVADSNKKAKLVTVSIGDIDFMSDEYQIVDGLSVDDYIIYPSEALSEGVSVELVEDF